MSRLARLRPRGAWPRGGHARRRATGLALFLSLLAPAAWLAERPRETAWTGVVDVPPPVERRRSTHLAAGWEVVVSPGRPGASRMTVRTRTRGGRVVAREERVLEVLRRPKAEVRLAGTARAPNPVGAPRVTRALRSYRVLATAYDPGPEDNGPAWTGTTRLGWRTRRGICAVDPAVIPLRSLLYVEGYGLAWAGDTGGAIRGMRLDLCFNTTAEAEAWGRRRVTVYVLAGVPGDARPAVRTGDAPATGGSTPPSR